jgi:uncharacterized protein (DUF1684 family)
MKYFLVYLFACAPLLGLTIYSALPDSVQPAPEVAAPLGGQTEHDAKAAEYARSRASDDAVAMHEFRSGDLLGRGAISGSDGLRTPTPTVNVLNAWRGFDRTRQVMLQYPIKGSSRETERLEGFVRSLTARPGAGGRFIRILEVAQRRLSDAVTDSARGASERLADVAFKHAQAAFDDARYKDCIGRCTALAGEITAGGFKNLTTEQVFALRDRAQYRLDWAKIATPAPGEKDDAWRARIETFLADRDEPAYAEEKQLHANLRGKLDDVRRAVGIARSRQQVEQAIRLLDRRQIARVDKLVAGGESVLGMLGQMKARKDITTAESQSFERETVGRIRTWLQNTFTRKKTTTSERADMQEVTKKDGSLLRGYFILYENKFYRHYKSRSAATKGSGSWTKLELAALADKPRLAMQWRCIARYDAYAARGIRTFPTQKAWQSRLALAQQLDAELAEYRKIPGANPGAFSFKPEAEMAQQILTHWDRLESLTGK